MNILRLLREFPDMDRNEQAGVIAGVCFLACALIPVLALASTQFRIYAPAVRNWLLAAVGA